MGIGAGALLLFNCAVAGKTKDIFSFGTRLLQSYFEDNFPVKGAPVRAVVISVFPNRVIIFSSWNVKLPMEICIE
jgi:hypothetical protein